MKRVGIPRALLFYQYFPMWKTFFEHLGAEIVTSPPTNLEILQMGISRTAPETCLPVKVFCGHAAWLCDKCDYLFIPGIRSLRPESYNCAKFLGLPDIVRAVVPEAPPIIDPDIELPKGRVELYLAIYKVGSLFTKNPLRIKQAAEAAWEAHRAYLNLMSARKLTAPRAIAEICRDPFFREPPKLPGSERSLRVAVIGHPYIIYDDFINHSLLRRLERMGIEVSTPEMIPKKELERKVLEIVGRFYWTYEDEVTGAGGYYLDEDPNVDGVIAVQAFGCGPDSLMLGMLEHHAKRSSRKPFLILTLDEHTSDVGLVTRLEAFVDMIIRRKRISQLQRA